jgi:hypothetical protein
VNKKRLRILNDLIKSNFRIIFVSFHFFAARIIMEYLWAALLVCISLCRQGDTGKLDSQHTLNGQTAIAISIRRTKIT